ncbi:hypothetical protein B9Z19DRAFT_1064772 [Tuber borchii]|uniref:Uncharacterized protein n=1 Tax=Tuber borchii TaxID=42251 RepID=A0A2T6ZTJ4_TUBBO|nr:hypothetical protein B9Z19DRAFT_1064772 [Tuber borchii]
MVPFTYSFLLLILALNLGGVTAEQNPIPKWSYHGGHHIARKIIVKVPSPTDMQEYWIPAYLKITFRDTSMDKVDIKVMSSCDDGFVSPEVIRAFNIGRIAGELSWDSKEQFDSQGNYKGSYYTENVQNSLDNILQTQREMEIFVKENSVELKNWWDKKSGGPFPRKVSGARLDAVKPDAVRGVKNCAPPSRGEPNQPYITHRQTMSTKIMDVEHTVTAELCKRIPCGAKAPAS